ncbi:TonB-dependent siderophore receptor [Mesobaculum littorinae]|uniref:TonB-dependent siderophore receptor n=2 Tax=Mesobaculum littorinae TaxID=2486419 RepID=A0A438AMC8_9RHOB|nr:TonB-dependent siderophore receptor [Mesobaculum littorinae]
MQAGPGADLRAGLRAGFKDTLRDGLRVGLRGGTAALALMLPAMATAQDTLGTIVLEAEEDAGTGPVGGIANPVTTTGAGTPTPLNEIPQSVTVIGSEALEARNVTTVGEALRYSAGVFSEVYGDDGDYDWHFIRGFQSDQTGVFWDGVQNLSYGFGSLYVDPYTLERIEVLRGPASVLYGGSNPGGVLNYVSKRPGGRVRELTFGANDAGRVWTGIDWGDDLGQGRAYRLTARIEGGDTYDDFNDGVRGVVAPGLSFTLDSGTKVTLLGNYTHADEQHSGGTFLPYYGTVVPADFGTIDPETNFSDPDWDYYDRRQGALTAIVEHEFGNGWSLGATGRIAHAEIEEGYFYPSGYDGFQPQPGDAGQLSLGAFTHDSTLDAYEGDLHVAGDITTGGVRHDLLVGIDARRFELDQTQTSNFTFTADPLDPTAPGTPVMGDPYIDGVTTQDVFAIYAQDQLRFGQGWIATANLRHDWVTTETRGLTEFVREDSETSYRAGLAYEFANGLTPYAAASSFFLPTIASPAEGVTKPESGDQIELGVKYAPAGMDAFVTASVFRIDRENVITGTFGNYSQLGEVRSQGVEVEGHYGFGNGVRLQAAATMLDLEVTEDANLDLVGNSPVLIPETQAALRLDYDFDGGLQGLSLGAGLRYQGESWADEANTLKVGTATLVDLYAGYDWDNGWGLDLAATNIGDEAYVTGCRGLVTCSYGAGRQISLDLTRRW